jgi:hypothetical protein
MHPEQIPPVFRSGKEFGKSYKIFSSLNDPLPTSISATSHIPDRLRHNMPLCNGMKRYLVEVNFGLVKIQKSSCDGGSDEFHGNRLGLASEV